MRRLLGPTAIIVMLAWLAPCTPSALEAAGLTRAERGELSRGLQAARAGRHGEARRILSALEVTRGAVMPLRTRLRVLTALARAGAELGDRRGCKARYDQALALAPRSSALKRLKEELAKTLARAKTPSVEEDEAPTVKLTILPRETRLYLNDELRPLPSDGILKLAPGRQVLEFRLKGHKSEQHFLRPRPGEKLKLSVRLYPISVHGAELYRKGKSLLQARKYDEAIKVLERAARDGHGPSALALGDLYLFGLGVPKSQGRAAVWYRQGCRSGDKTCMIKWNGLKKTASRKLEEKK